MINYKVETTYHGKLELNVIGESKEEVEAYVQGMTQDELRDSARVQDMYVEETVESVVVRNPFED